MIWGSSCCRAPRAPSRPQPPSATAEATAAATRKPARASARSHRPKRTPMHSQPVLPALVFGPPLPIARFASLRDPTSRACPVSARENGLEPELGRRTGPLRLALIREERGSVRLARVPEHHLLPGG